MGWVKNLATLSDVRQIKEGMILIGCLEDKRLDRLIMLWLTLSISWHFLSASPNLFMDL